MNHKENIKIFFDNLENKGKTFKIDEEFSKSRSMIHQFCKDNNFKSITKTLEGKKYVFITDTSFDHALFDKGEVEIELFSKYSGITFPNNRPDNFNYYIELFDKYYNTKNKYKLFMDSFSKFNNLSEMKNHIGTVLDDILLDISKNEQISKLLKEYNPELIKEKIDGPNIRNNYYKEDLCDVNLISFDIQSANISILNTLVPSFLNGGSWENYMRKFTDCEFLIKSKYFREVVCGKSKIHNISAKRYNTFLKQCFNTIKDIGNLKLEDIVCINSDELVFKKNINIEILKKIKKCLDNKFPNLFRVESFVMKRIGGKSFYVKEYNFGEKSIEFKHCQKAILCQIIKKYENEPIENIDLEFFESNNCMMARYLKSVFDK